MSKGRGISSFMVCFFRSLIFNIVFYPYVFSIAIAYRFVKPSYYQKLIKNYSRGLYYILKVLTGLDYKILHPENKKNYPVIYAIKHESAWETMVLLHVLSPCTFVMKKELSEIPVFGKFLTDTGMIAIDRENAIQSVRQIVKGTKEAVQNGNSIVIFPEGTRAKPGELKPLHTGIYSPYALNKLSVIPVFLDSGKFWSRKSFFKKPGEITVDFLDEIKPGLQKEEFMNKLTGIFQKRLSEER